MSRKPMVMSLLGVDFQSMTAAPANARVAASK